ncbi:MAG: hypothetical protein AVDCRST_MAG60-1191 [uncultured Nocardioides sp.]|uniref:Integral membrane protein n=1 Tax=uncultured Nocardioides sp. TaxID=198441 RepID=A0A6J4NHV5_9ACTN|nr:MAG: hypothetical protein AVDCRST_MAG60-1191 [uncultured Nocardioides sp.]
MLPVPSAKRPRLGLLGRVLVSLAVLVVGACAAIAATLVHERWWGLTLGLGAVALSAYALPPGGRRFAFVLGWFGAITYAVLPRTEGDYLIASSGAGYALLGGSFAVFLTALATLPGPRSRRRGGAGDPSDLEG